MSNLFGAFNDQEEQLEAGDSGKFGLNTNAFITKLEYNPNAAAGGESLDAFDLTVKVGDREYRNRIFDVNSVYDRETGGPRELDMNDAKDQSLYAKEIKQAMGVIGSAVKATGVTQERIDKAFTQPANNFVDWGKIMVSLLPDNFESNPVDVFLEYQWTISEGQDRTYPTLPRNLKGGRFLCAAVKPQQGPWKEDRTEEGELRYLDGAGNEHPISRKASFMDSKKGYQQGGDTNTRGASKLISPENAAQATNW